MTSPLGLDGMGARAVALVKDGSCGPAAERPAKPVLEQDARPRNAPPRLKGGERVVGRNGMKWGLAGTWISLWAASLLLPVAIMGPLPDNVFPGWLILAIGWMGVLVGQFGWGANLILPAILALTLVKRPPPVLGLVLVVLQGVLLVNALFWREMYGDNGSAAIPRFGLGYYAWFAAMIGSAGTLLALSFSAWSGRRFHR